MVREDDPDLWEAMRRLAGAYWLEDRPTGTGLVLEPMYGEELEHATLQLEDDGRLWLGLKDGRKWEEPDPEL